MNDTFYQFFVRDEESPEYTACMALIIFNELKRIHLIDADDADDKDCRRIADFKIPERYKHDTQNDGATEHCWYLSYKYGYSGHVPPCREDEFYIRKVCSLGICKNQYDLNLIQGKILDWTKKYCYGRYPPKRKSTASQYIV